MGVFELGKSNAFGNNRDVSKGNYGTNFWGHNIFKFDGSVNDRKNLLTSCKTFVRLLTGKSIPVKYSTKNDDSSYTDGKVITISSKIIPECLDSTIGLVLHESSHCILTDFKLIKNLIEKVNVPTRFHNYVNYIKNLHNWIEDRRIDNWTFNKKPGFKIYYLELYDRYFYCKEIEEALKKDKKFLKKETGRGYEFFIINSLHPKVKMNELKGLSEIKELIEIDNIERLKSTADTIDLSYQIMDVILKYIPDTEKEKINNENYSLGKPKLSDKDISDILKQLLDMQESYLDGDPTDIDGNTIKIEIEINEEKLVDALEKADTKVEKVEGSKGTYEVVTVNHIDESSIQSDLYQIFDISKNKKNIAIINEGLKLGLMLGRKLQIRNDIKTLKTVRLRSGKIDKRNIYSAGHGNNNIFQTTSYDKYNDMSVHLSIDMSSSMKGEKWYQTLKGLVAIAKGNSLIKGIRTQISLRYGGNLLKPPKIDNEYIDEAIIINFYDSAFDNIKKIELLAYAKPYGSTPEGVCFEALANNIMKPLLNKDTLFINFSDGCPCMHSMDTETGIQITTNVIKKFKSMGMSILSYFINSEKSIYYYENDNSREDFIRMYGKESEFIDVQNMMEVAKTINKQFLKMGKNN